MPRSTQLACLLAVATAAVACADVEPGVAVDGTHTESDVTEQLGLAYRRRPIDVLFVIDDSPSMAQEQGLLAANFANFVAVLEAPDVDVMYRVAVTTTDTGNPWCDAADSERGAFVSSSCRSRVDDFGEVFDAGCADVCGSESIEILPTTTAYDDTPRARPWIERSECQTNVGACDVQRVARSCDRLSEPPVSRAQNRTPTRTPACRYTGNTVGALSNAK